MHTITKIGVSFLLCNLFILRAFGINLNYQSKVDSTNILSSYEVKKSIYDPNTNKRSRFYNLIVGKHYRELYAIPITIKTFNIDHLYGGLKITGQLPRLQGVFLEDKSKHMYLARPLGGATTFLEANFFKTIYNKNEFKDTFIDKFIGDAYTITHPYGFKVANKLAKYVNISSFNSEIYYLPKQAQNDSIAKSMEIEEGMISIYDLKTLNTYSTVIETPDLLKQIQKSKMNTVDPTAYIRERLLDIVIGDWNKTGESWQWYEVVHNDSLQYTPLVVNRSHAFTRIDGVLFKLMLNVLGLGSITNYDSSIRNLKKSNGIAIPLDIAIIGQVNFDTWYKEAKYVRSMLTDSVIDKAFEELPIEIYNTEDTKNIIQNLKTRRNKIEIIAQKYYDILNKTPVITGTNNDDLFIIEHKDKNLTNIRIYDPVSNSLIFDKDYNEKTEEIWLYGLEGNDVFRINRASKKAIPITLVGGKGMNVYRVAGGKKITIYDYKTHDLGSDTLGQAKFIRTDIDKVHEYDYQKLKYKTVNFTPWGVYDSDLGFYLGAYVSKTMYGFKRSPYSYKHRIGYSYLDGLMYQGLFPSLDERKAFSIEAIFGIANFFHNFFGYGNRTAGQKDMPIDYNRVSIGKYSIQPSYYWRVNQENKITVQSTWEFYNIERTDDRFINQIYDEDAAIFNKKMFLDLNFTYEINKESIPYTSSADLLFTTGWTWNLRNNYRNFPYVKSKLMLEFPLIPRVSLATALLGTIIFSNDYEFYQAATIDLRGFRDFRFIGRQSFYQRTDLRLNLGQLKNPFTPLQFGVFTGFDHGRVWYPREFSDKWHISYGGGLWITLFKKYTGKFSYFGSDDGTRFYIGLGLGL